MGYHKKASLSRVARPSIVSSIEMLSIILTSTAQGSKSIGFL